ncbi:hypothetical protein [Streptomyces jumonjinensis]|uniref:hypothetical protein n=1 Tax=Streptomyces jumonjinensis TaxID=1945 RepID=UPI00379B0498
MELIAALPLQSHPPLAMQPARTRPYALAGARFVKTTTRADGPVEVPVFNPLTQTAAYADGTPLTAMATSKKTNPDGSIKNPPPSDEGADPGVFE